MLRNMKLETKLFFWSLTAAFITLALGAIGYYGAIKGEKSVHEIGVVRMPSIDNLLIIRNRADKQIESPLVIYDHPG